MNPVELIGYLASALIVLSLAMRSIVKLRVLSMTGGIVFTVYGLLIGAWPIVITNVAVTLVNIWALRREVSTTAQSIAAVPIERDAPFLGDFLGAHAMGIQATQPEYHPSPTDSFVRLLTRDGFPAGVLVGQPAGKELLVKLDYVTPAYRDSQIAKWLFGAGKRTFTDAGFTRLVATAHTTVHRHYLEFVGFRPEGGSYVLDLSSDTGRA